MIVTIMQPAYLPWLGFFDRIRRSDLCISLDHVQIDRNSRTKFANRNKVRTAQGWTWLTVPIRTGGRYGNLPLDVIEIDSGQDWAVKHWKTIEGSYRRARFFAAWQARLAPIYADPPNRLLPLCRRLTGELLQGLGITTRVVSSLDLACRDAKDLLILNLCREVGATTYLSGPFGRDYLDRGAFRAAGIELLFHDYRHPTYTQAFPGFEPYMSAIDLAFTHGPDSLGILATDGGLAEE